MSYFFTSHFKKWDFLMAKRIKKNITLEDLAQIMSKGFVSVEKNTDKKIDNLAGMVQRGFLDVDKKFKEVDKRFDNIDKRFDDLGLKMSSWISIYRKDIEILDNKIDNAIERIETLEQKVGIR